MPTADSGRGDVGAAGGDVVRRVGSRNSVGESGFRRMVAVQTCGAIQDAEFGHPQPARFCVPIPQGLIPMRVQDEANTGFCRSLLAGDFTFHRVTTSWVARKQAPTSRQMSLILEVFAWLDGYLRSEPTKRWGVRHDGLRNCFTGPPTTAHSKRPCPRKIPRPPAGSPSRCSPTNRCCGRGCTAAFRSARFGRTSRTSSAV